MSPLATSAGSVLINGRFLRGLWGRREDDLPVECPAWAQTFLADRWRVRSAAPTGGGVSQRCSEDVPPDSTVERSLELRGGAGIEHAVCLGQNVEAAEASSFRRQLRFTAWICVEHSELRAGEVTLVIGSPRAEDLFDASVEEVARVATAALPVDRWQRIDFCFDARGFRTTGLRVDLEFPAAFLNHPSARVRIADVALFPAAASEPGPRPAALEAFLAGRFFQRHDAQRINGVGRALVCNPHELHFQFPFPEMHSAPACTISQDNADLCVFAEDGQPQAGFAYDVTYRARSSVTIRATKMRHQLRDGYLAFRRFAGVILLDAEL